MAIPLDRSGGGSGSPATRWFTITPSDVAMLPVYPRAVTVEGAGTVSAEDCEGNIGAFVFAAGEIKAIRPVRIRASGTSATGILGLY